jgi:predicted DNA-binding protein
MVRTQIQLPAEQHRRLKDLAHQRGISLSELIRRLLVEKLNEGPMALDAPDRLKAALAVCGRHRDLEGLTDVAADHDRHLAESIGVT